jgi:hypothetical protein
VAPHGIRLCAGGFGGGGGGGGNGSTGDNGGFGGPLFVQIERVLDLNNLHIVSTEVVEMARDSLVIGQG